MSEVAPRLRAVEAFPVEHEGARYVALRDPAGYTSSVAMIPHALLEVVSLFDGEHSIADIQVAVHRVRGTLLARERIAELAATLDAHGFLDSDAFQRRRATMDAEFVRAASRPAAHAGGAYDSTPDGLRAMIAGFFTLPGAPGSPTPLSGPRIAGLIAPHIDFHRGGPGYAWAYRDVATCCDVDVFVIFGTCHAGMRDPFALTRKAYETPLGAARVDAEFVDALARRARQDCFASEIAHRSEHSIEFQTVMLRWAFDGRRDVRIVPVLTSFAHEALASGRRPTDDPRVPAFLDAVVDTAAALGRRVAYVAGADLAHVGPRFGDPEPVSTRRLAAIEAADRAMLGPVVAGDAEAFFASVEADGDERRICGLSPIYALLRCLDAPGRLAHYAAWRDPQGVVSFASLVY